MSYEILPAAHGELRVDRNGMAGFKVVNPEGQQAIAGDFFLYRDADKARDFAQRTLPEFVK